jgi:hypothetical protein
MFSQQQVLFEKYFTPAEIKKGGKSCPCCGRQVKAYGYNLSKNILQYAGAIYDYCDKRNDGHFRSKDVFGDDHMGLTQFPKLKYFDIIRSIPKSDKWFMTKRGREFLEGKIQLPRKAWAFNSQTILIDDNLIWIWQADKDWKVCSGDWKVDYILKEYNTDL